MSMKSEGSGKGYCLYHCLQHPICVQLEDCLGVVFCEVVCVNGCKLAVDGVEHALIVNTGLSAGMPPENIANVLPLDSCFEKSAVMAQSLTAGSCNFVHKGISPGQRTCLLVTRIQGSCRAID